MKIRLSESQVVQTQTFILGTQPFLILQLVGVSRSTYFISSSYVRWDSSLWCVRSQHHNLRRLLRKQSVLRRAALRLDIRGLSTAGGRGGRPWFAHV